MSTFRRVSAVAIRAGVTRAADFGAAPQLVWVAPTDLLVDEAYQRDAIGARSRRIIERIVAEFAWRKMKPPVVVRVGEDYHCIDGQHTAIAAATLRIKSIPVFVVDAEDTESRADAFVAHNRNRVAMTPFDIFRAKLAANDPDALDVRNVCSRAGVRIKLINQASRVDVGDTAAVGTIQRIVKRQGVAKARMVLEALVKGRRAPIGASEIDAVEAAMVLVRPQTTVDEMAAVIAAVGEDGLVECRVRAASEGKPHKHAIFDRYMQLLEKQTGVKRVIAS